MSSSVAWRSVAPSVNQSITSSPGGGSGTDDREGGLSASEVNAKRANRNNQPVWPITERTVHPSMWGRSNASC